MSKTILVLGGGIGGITTARELSKEIGNEEGINLANILVFEKEEKNVYQPSLTWLMVGKRNEEQVYRNTKDIEMGGIEVILGDIENINPEEISVMVKGETYTGDYMIVSLGVEQVAEYNLSDAGHNFYTLDGANAFYEELKDFKGGHIAITVPSLPFKSPVAPYEAVMLVEDYIREKGLRNDTQICLYTPEAEPMGFAGEQISKNVMKLMSERGIQYMVGHQLSSVEGKTLNFETASGKSKTVEADLLAHTPKHKTPSVIEGTGLVGESGWIDVNRETMETKFKRVFAIGDITEIELESGEKLPKAGVFAQRQAEVVAHNIAKDIYGKSPGKKFEGQGKYVLELGGDKAGKVSGNFYSSEVKMNNTGVIHHWEKVLNEKSWFKKYF